MTASQLPLEGPVGSAPAGEPALDEQREDKGRRRKAFLLAFLLGVLLFLIGLTLWYLLFRQPIKPPIPVVPDTALPAYSTSFYDVKRPMGVAVDGAGDRIYVTETEGTFGVLMFDGSGKRIGTMSPPNDGVDHVFVYLAIDPLTQEVYVTDRMTGAVYVYDSIGRYQREYKPATPVRGWQPLGIAFDKAGELYVTDVAGPAQVEVFDRRGALVRTIGADRQMAFPNGVSVDDSGNVYVTDSNNGRLLVFDSSGKLLGQVGRGVGEGNLGLPRGVAVTGDRVYVADSTGQGVFSYRPLGSGDTRPSYVGFLGGEGSANGQFEFPNGIAVDGRGRVYVTDSVNDRVQVWSY